MTSLHYCRSPAALHANVGNDVVALHVRNGRCFGMEKVTADIWRQLEQAATVDQICASLLDEYDVDAETCRSDVAEILEIMQREGLVDAIPSQGNVR